LFTSLALTTSLCSLSLYAQVSELQATAQQLAATNEDLRQQLAALQGSQTEVQQLQDRLAQAEQLKESVARLTAENTQVRLLVARNSTHARRAALFAWCRRFID
jgi:cell shape-determining protein MreC